VTEQPDPQTPAAPNKPSHQRRSSPLLLSAALAVILVAGGIAAWRWGVISHAIMPLPAGNELITADLQPYGWDGSMNVGSRFTDGLNNIRVSDKAKGPLRIVAAKPIESNGQTLKVIGVLARVKPDMRPKGWKDGWFQSAPGFPPTENDSAGGVDPQGLIVRVPKPGELLELEIQIGYEVVAAGKSNRRAVEVEYEYQGQLRRLVIPSHLSICAPASVKCSPEQGV